MWGWSGLQSVIVLFISMLAGGISIFISIGIVGGIVGSSLTLFAASAVNCIVGCVLWGWKMVTGGLPVGIFSVILEFVVIGIFFDFIGGVIFNVIHDVGSRLCQGWCWECGGDGWWVKNHCFPGCFCIQSRQYCHLHCH